MKTGRSFFQRWSDRTRTADAELILAAAVLGAALMIGLVTAPDYGFSVDEFNTDDYGPKALAWYASGFADRSQFETVEFSLWYYGPWFQMLTAYVQSFDFADHVAVRHVMTFLVGLAGLAALVPIGRLAMGRWAGLTAVMLCLLTGYLYGSLFFTPIDVPFLAAMTWATLAILLMTRQVLPSWPATLATGALTGLAIATRTGGIITHAYLFAALLLCAVEFWIRHRALTPRYLAALAARYAAVLVVAWIVAIALWPWLQTGNPLEQFKIALVHFANIPTEFEFSHWGERVWTNALPRSYIAGQLVARLPEGFLLLLIAAVVAASVSVFTICLDIARRSRAERRAGIVAAIALFARKRGAVLVSIAVILPLGFLIAQRATVYDGVRHVLFVIPMLAVLAGGGLRALLPLLRRVPILSAATAGAYAASLLATLAVLHPLEYVAMNRLAGGVPGAYGKFDLDYWSLAATEALRRLEARLDYDRLSRAPEVPPSIVVCIPWRESMIAPILHRPWTVETDPDKAEFIIETERSRCAQNQSVVLIDEVKRFDRTFAWVYARQPRN